MWQQLNRMSSSSLQLMSYYFVCAYKCAIFQIKDRNPRIFPSRHCLTLFLYLCYFYTIVLLTCLAKTIQQNVNYHTF